LIGEGERLRKIISILKGVLNGSIDGKAAINDWPDIDRETDSLIKAVWHDLSHYANDADIRQRDSKYGEQQMGLLKAGLAKLENRVGSAKS
jgi:hypothetical protein